LSPKLRLLNLHNFSTSFPEIPEVLVHIFTFLLSFSHEERISILGRPAIRVDIYCIRLQYLPPMGISFHYIHLLCPNSMPIYLQWAFHSITFIYCVQTVCRYLDISYRTLVIKCPHTVLEVWPLMSLFLLPYTVFMNCCPEAPGNVLVEKGLCQCNRSLFYHTYIIV
jgi:hypothetical protein